jgi:hypothetical protein
MTDARTILARVTDSIHRPRSFVAATVRDAFHRDRADGFDPSPIFWDVTGFDAGELRLMARDNRVLAVGCVEREAWAVDVTDDLEALLG